MSTVDAVTGRAMVVLQDRPVVALTAWLDQALTDCAETGRTLQVVTPLRSRLSFPLRNAGARWVVHNDDTYYEGLTGRPLMWTGAEFGPVPDARDYAPGFVTRPTAPIGAQLSLVYRTRHDAEGKVSITVERLLRLLTGKSPLGWSPAEPIANAWNPERLTEHVRARSTARLIVLGDGPRPAQAICEFTALGTAVTEVTTVNVGFAPQDPPPLKYLPQLVGAFASEQPIASLFVQLIPGRADLTTEPRWTGAPGPLAMAVNGTVTGPPDIPTRQVGSQFSPMTLFTLGDGRSPEGWQHHRALMQHLRPS
ncbi:DUF6177 family protein [Spirillospora sp. CA-294931]|uniref:DUF6177 family protein n=1 Tax=Spirillospora sp. CA-294931 TaxID=3240042 RepID=UPI003D930CE9